MGIFSKKARDKPVNRTAGSSYSFIMSGSNDLDETLNYISNTLCNDVAASDFYNKL